MNLANSIGDLLRQAPPRGLIYSEHCSNCGAYLHEQKGNVELCPKCERICDPEMQIWECSKCATVRVYGIGFAHDPTPKQLPCIGCGKTQRHIFSHVNGRGRASL